MANQDPWTYELLVKDMYDQLLRKEGIEVFHRKKYRGLSGQLYEIDLSFEFVKVGVRLLVLIECKCYSQAVGVGEAPGFSSKLSDIGAQKGVLVTTKRFQRGVFRVAKASGIALVKIYAPGEYDPVISSEGPLEAEYYSYFEDYHYERQENSMPLIEFLFTEGRPGGFYIASVNRLIETVQRAWRADEPPNTVVRADG